VAEARTFLAERYPRARRALGPNHVLTLGLGKARAQVLYDDGRGDADQRAEACSLLEELLPRTTRVLGPDNPQTCRTKDLLDVVRAARDGTLPRGEPDLSSAGDVMTARGYANWDDAVMPEPRSYGDAMLDARRLGDAASGG